jgi:hypothetical protein
MSGRVRGLDFCGLIRTYSTNYDSLRGDGELLEFHLLRIFCPRGL